MNARDKLRRPAGLYAAALAALPLCLHFPYHFAFLSLALGGVMHTVAEANYWLVEERILIRRKVYPPIIFIGALLLTAVPFLLLWTDFRDKTHGPLYARVFFLAIFVYIFISAARNAFRGPTRGGGLLLFCGGGAALALFSPLAAAFALIHGHNLMPWIFLGRKSRHKLRVFAHFAMLSLVLPGAAALIYYGLDISIANIALNEQLETDLFRHSLAHLTPIQPELLLLSLFGYFQFMHYVLWIFIVPDRSFRETWREPARFIPELLMFAGFSRRLRAWYFLIPLGAILAALILFIFFPVEWRRIYFAIIAFHVMIEFPLIFLFQADEKKLTRPDSRS